MVIHGLFYLFHHLPTHDQQSIIDVQAQDSLYLLVFLGLHDEGGLGHAQLFKASFE